MTAIAQINIGGRSRTIYKREQSITQKLAGMDDNSAQIAFTFYVTAIAAKLACIDMQGDVNIPAQIESFKEIFSISDKEKEKVEELYYDAVADPIPASHYSKQLVNLFGSNRLLLEELVNNLFLFADADTPITPARVNFLKEAVLALNFNERYFARILRKHLLNAKENPFELLDVNRNISYVDLKKKYRSAIKDWHPDKFSAKDIAPEFSEIAREQFDLYSKAYESVKLSLGFSRESKG